MAKRKPKNEVVKETIEEKIDELIGGNVEEEQVEVKVTEEVVAQIVPVKEKRFLGYHPITKEEVWA